LIKDEARAILRVKETIEDCGHEEIQQLFSLQAVMRQESQLIQQLSAFSGRDFAYIYERFEQDCRNENMESVTQLIKDLGTDFFKQSEILQRIQLEARKKHFGDAKEIELDMTTLTGVAEIKK